MIYFHPCYASLSLSLFLLLLSSLSRFFSTPVAYVHTDGNPCMGVGEEVKEKEGRAAREHFRLFSRSVGINIYRLAASISGEPPGEPPSPVPPAKLRPRASYTTSFVRGIFGFFRLLFSRFFLLFSTLFLFQGFVYCVCSFWELLLVTTITLLLFELGNG